jgi:hypothetical protein
MKTRIYNWLINILINRVTRLEIISNRDGRHFYSRIIPRVEASLQDDERTIKIFIE